MLQTPAVPSNLVQNIRFTKNYSTSEKSFIFLLRQVYGRLSLSQTLHFYVLFLSHARVYVRNLRVGAVEYLIKGTVTQGSLLSTCHGFKG